MMATMRATMASTAPTWHSSGKLCHNTRAIGPILGSNDLQRSFLMIATRHQTEACCTRDMFRLVDFSKLSGESNGAALQQPEQS